MSAHAPTAPSATRCAHIAVRGCFADHPRAWRLPARVWHRRVPHRPVAAAAASSRDDVDDVDGVDAAASASSATSSPLASAAGVVVTSQANFLRVVVHPRDLTRGQIANREAQLRDAQARAAEAGKADDVERLRRLVDDRRGPYELLCVVRALLKKIKRRVLVGDDVSLTGVDWVDHRAMVHDVVPRRSSLVDPPVANVDRALLVFALERPPLEAKQLTRFLVSMEHTRVPFDLVLNKCDLVDETTKADWAARLEQWGYEPRFVSVATGEGMDELEADLARRESREEGESGGDEEASARARVTVLAGPSGVGKSSLINRLRAGSALAEALAEAGKFGGGAEERARAGDAAAAKAAESGATGRDVAYVTDVDISGGGGGARGALNLRLAAGVELQSVKAVSAKLGRGRHTTRHVTLLPLKSGGLLADTPGFGYPSLEGVTVDEVTSGALFPEIARARAIEGRCKFADCTHRDEPGCAVDAVMPWEEERYDMYCDVFDEVEAGEKAEKAAGYKRETRVRYKDAASSSPRGAETKRRTRQSVRDASATRAAASVEDEDEDEDEGVEGKARSRALSSRRRARKDANASASNARRANALPGGRTNRRMEPKLETKSARRRSRRAFNMETAEMEAGAWGDGEAEDEDDATLRVETTADAETKAADGDEHADWARFARLGSGADAEAP